MTNLRERSDMIQAEIAGSSGYIWTKGHGKQRRIEQYKAWCRRHFSPALVIANDGEMHIRLELDLSPTGHRMTADTDAMLWDYLRGQIDYKHLREGTLTMMGGGTYLWCRRIPRLDFDETIARIKAILEPTGALELDGIEGMRLVAAARGSAGDWNAVNAIHTGDYRAELRTAVTS